MGQLRNMYEKGLLLPDTSLKGYVFWGTHPLPGTELGPGYHGGDQDPTPVLALFTEPSAGYGLAPGKSGQWDLSRARQRTIQGAEAIHRRKR